MWQYITYPKSINMYPKTRYCCLSVSKFHLNSCCVMTLNVTTKLARLCAHRQQQLSSSFCGYVCHRDLRMGTYLCVNNQHPHLSLKKKRPRCYVKSPTGHAPCGNDSLCSQSVESALPIAWADPTMINHLSSPVACTCVNLC